MSRWIIKEKQKDFQSFDGIHPILAKLLFQKGIRTDKEIKSFLFPDYQNHILDPFLFSDMEKAMERVKKARDQKEKVLIYGDYDVDGVTSSAILEEALQNIGIKAEIYIPNKKTEGYGMNLEAIEEFKKRGINLIISVDCGISNYNEIEKANEYSIDSIIIDHHHVPEKTPSSHAIINPQMENSGYPFRNLAGVGVAFKFVQAIYKKFIPEKEEQLKWMLDLVSLGTIADCVPLISENRVIAKYGLLVLSKTRRIGLQELFTVGRIMIDENNVPDVRTIAFQVAPRINSAGRMDHAGIALRLIQEKDTVSARGLALELEANNQKRQKATSLIVDEIRILANNMFQKKPFIFALGEHFPAGILGLAAGKIADEFGKPTAVVQKGEKTSKGSLRSIPEVDIISAIEKCKKYLLKFGGHSQAAGIEASNENLDNFFKELNSLIEKEIGGKDLSKSIGIDLEITPEEIDLTLADEIRKMEPFGVGNEEPVFLMKNMVVVETRVVGNGNKHLKLQIRPQKNSPKIFECIGFGMGEEFKNLKSGKIIDTVFNIREDHWNGNKKLQLRLIDLKKNTS